MSKILIVDDETSICWALEHALTEEGHSVTTTATAEDAFDLIKAEPPHVVVMDVRLPGTDGLSALAQIKALNNDIPVVIITAFGNLETAVKAINRGAFEYLTKPFNLDDAIQVINRAIQSKYSGTAPAHVEGSPTPASDQSLLGNSAAMQIIYRDIAIVAERDVPVLITGESGTGKELVAAAIHRYSKRSTGPFVPICIPAMSETVLESELFGHTRGAFTGAAERRSGHLKAADKGTAFFDELGEIALSTQVKLLRVLESRSITPVGGEVAEHSDFRLLAATNQDLESMVAAGTFRKDLYFRLNVYSIHIPPLRERTDDIPLLAEHFMKLIDPAGKVRLSDATINELLSRPWLGNVRELRNTIEHAVITTRTGEIQPNSLPDPIPLDSASTRKSASLGTAVRNWVRKQVPANEYVSQVTNLYDSFLAESETVLFTEALELTEGNRQEAAKLLGIHRQTLREKLRRYQVRKSI